MERLRGKPIVGGNARGVALVTREPLSFWGGVNPSTGEVIDRRHDLSGEILAGRILVVPRSRGSSSTSSTLLEAIRAGTGPAAIIAASVDPVLALGAIIADELYQQTVPVVVLDESQFVQLRTGDVLVVHPDGTVAVERTKGEA